MLGAIIGDIAGSRFEFNNYRAKDFELFSDKCFFTDDSVMSLAVADAILRCGTDLDRLGEETVRSMQSIGRDYPNCGYGGRFQGWIWSDDPQPYHSFGNGAAMRVSAVAWATKDLEECKALSRAVTQISHDHPEGIKGAEATAVCVWMALHGATKDELRAVIERDYYTLDFTIDEIRPTYRFNETCQDTVPQALEAFLEGESFEDVIRTSVSVGGDSDTLAAIAGSIAEAFYGIPSSMRASAMAYLDPELLQVLQAFEAKYGSRTL